MGSCPHLDVALFFLEYNALVVGKAIKASLAVVAAHAAFAHATKGHAVVCRMDNHIVYATTAKAYALYYTSQTVFSAAKR